MREFVEAAFAHAGLDWREHVSIDPRYYRPAEVDELRADASKAAACWDGTPRVSFRELVKMMVDADIAELRRSSKAAGKRSGCWRGFVAWLVP